MPDHRDPTRNSASADTPGPATPSGTRLVALDGLRGIAILLVLLHHYVELNAVGPEKAWSVLRNALRLSWSGVDLFFVLSGFLIGGILLENRTSPRLLVAFYARRGVRILPLYFVTLGVIFFGFGHLLPNSIPGWMYMVFASNIGTALAGHWDIGALAIMWSLAVEEQFYLFAPWLVRWMSPARLPFGLLALVFIAIGCRQACAAVDPSRLAAHVVMPCRLDGFASGMLVAWAIRSAEARAWIDRNIPRAGLLSLIVVVLAWLTVRRVHEGDADLRWYGYTLLAAGFAGIVYLLATHQAGRLESVLSQRWLVRLGRISYFVYLWHILVILVLGQLVLGHIYFPVTNPAGVGTMLLAAVVTYLLAEISWRWLESPMIRLGHRLKY